MGRVSNAHDSSLVGIEKGSKKQYDVNDLDVPDVFDEPIKKISLKSAFEASFGTRANQKLKNTVFGMPFFKISKVFFKRLYAWLDPEVMRFAAKLSTSFEMNVEPYNFAINHRDEMREMEAICPALLPLGYVEKINSIKLLKDYLTKPMREHSDPLTEAGWRWVTKQKPSVIGGIVSSQSVRRVVRIANFLSADGVDRPNFFTLIKGLDYEGVVGEKILEAYENGVLHEYQDIFSNVPVGKILSPAVLKRIIARYAKEAFKEADLRAKKGSVKDFALNDLMLVRDWLRNDLFKSLVGDFSWKGVMRKQHAWHKEQALIQVAKNPHHWNSVVDSAQYGNVSVTALNSSQELVDEGYRMHHCVSSYVKKCTAGESRIFSIFDESKNAYGTLELRLSESKKNWSMAQLRSNWNKKVSKEINDAGLTFTKAFNKAWRQLDESQVEVALESFKGLREEYNREAYADNLFKLAA